jgi:hypothetical protein
MPSCGVLSLVAQGHLSDVYTSDNETDENAPDIKTVTEQLEACMILRHQHQ